MAMDTVFSVSIAITWSLWEHPPAVGFPAHPEQEQPSAVPTAAASAVPSAAVLGQGPSRQCSLPDSSAGAVGRS